MKRILLTTTSLVLAAGVAQADITFSGSAGVALIDDNGASVATNTAASLNAAAAAAATAKAVAQEIDDVNDAAVAAAGAAVTAAQTAAATASAAAVVTANTALTAANAAVVAGAAAANTTARATRDDMFFESYYDFNITASAESDNGISVSVGFDMGAGNMIDYNDDDELEAQGNDVGDADVSVGYAGWTVTVDHAGIDNLFDDTDGAHDAKIAGTIAGWSVAMTTDQSESHNSYSVSGAVAGVTLTATGTNNDDNGGSASKIAASYAMGDLTLKGSVEDESLASGAEDDSTLGFSYAMGDLSVGYTTIKPGSAGAFGDEWDFSAAYAAGAVSASFALDETDATTIIVDYDLGGGASAFAAMHDKAGTDSDLTAFGLNFAF
ncbi:hypothetical protein N8468_01940 [Planktomarina temperata]|nr:hypothetical protein [Planktomarina temperata]